MSKLITTLLLLILAASVYYGYLQSPLFAIATDSPHTGTTAESTGITDTDHETETFTREEVDHAFGTKPNIVHYPAKAIDTEEVPSIAIKESISDNEPLHTYQISPNTYLFYGNIAEVDENNRGSNGNAGFVITEDSVVVIDSLGTPKLGKRIIATIKKITDKPIKYLIITHNHPDHAYGAIAFRELGGVQIIGHEGTIRYIESDRIEHSVAYRETFIKSDMKGFKPVVPDVLIRGALYSKTSITTGGKTIDIYNSGSHHSYGDLVIHQVEDNIVWVSDLAFHNRVTFMADGNSQEAIDAQNWLLTTFADAKLMVPGHGSAQTSPFPMVTDTQDYMKQVRKDVTDAINNDLELQEAVDTIEFENWKSLNMYGLNHKKNIDFVYRELEEELF